MIICVADGELRIVKQSPSTVDVTSLNTPCPVYCVAYPHTVDTVYEWCTVPEGSSALTQTPVLFAAHSTSYMCKVRRGESEVKSDIITVRVIPCKCFRFICA